MNEVITWKSAGETTCACCGARYKVASAEVQRRGFAYVRCQKCETVIDEWISNVVRSYDLIDAQAA